MQWPAPIHPPSTARTWRWAAPLWLGLLWLSLTLLGAVPAKAQPAPAAELVGFELTRADDGLQLAFAVNFELPRGVEEALQKGVPLYFVAQAEVLRSRWYWRDRRVAQAERTWRLAFQPLTRKYRVSFGGLNQSFDSLPDALVAVRRIANWRITEPGVLESGTGYYVEFSYRLDTSLLPRPLQIGLGGQADWNLQVERVQRLD